MSLSQFTQQDNEMIAKEYEILKGMAERRCTSQRELEIVGKAFDFANQAHMNVRRRSGVPYMIHPIQVAEIVVSDIGLGYKSIAAALLHDVVEDTDYTVDDIRNLFGEKIASLVDGLTKIKTVLDNEDRNKNLQSLQAENFKRILLTLNDDARVVLIKLADRLHNCRTIEFMPEHKRDKILSETMYVFIPLAHRLGLYSIKSEMENIWLRFKEPDAYREITDRVNRNVAVRDREIDDFIAPIRQFLKSDGHNFEIKKRIKTPYSIWRKMQTKHVPFEQIYDLYAVRIIYDPQDRDELKERQEAMQIYSTIMGLYNENPSRFRNWISSPKSNGYEALHCTVMSRSGVWIEVQIRSRRMDDIAEKGIAAHWSYKREGYISENDSEMDRWLAKIQEILVSNDINNLDFLDLIHADLTSTDISVFTPQGEQKTIAAGATALDFAYSIHSQIGHKAAAAKINMKLVPLSQTLKSGDQVEIITIDNSHPKREWLEFLKTRHARNQVVDFFRSQRPQIAAEGKEIFEKRLKSLDVKLTNVVQRTFLEYAQVNDLDELYFKVGLGLIGPDVFSLLSRDFSPSRFFEIDGEKYVFASCCKPFPGDAVTGLRDEDGVIHIHKKSCPMVENVSTKHGDRIVAIHWPDIERDFPVRLSLKGMDRLGLLNELSFYISKTMGVNMRHVTLDTDNGVFDGYIDMMVHDKEALEKMIEGLSRIEGIQDVSRTNL